MLGVGVRKLNLEVIGMLRSVLTAPFSSPKYSLVVFIVGSTGIFNKTLLKCP